MRRSSGFGSCSYGSPPLKTAALVVRLRPCRFPCASPDTPVRLAIQTHSLARFSKRTTEHRLPVSLTGDSRLGHSSWDLVCPVARSPTDFMLYFASLLRVLCSVRSHYLFTIGLRLCLAFAVDACVIREGYPTPATLALPHSVLVSSTGLSPCITLCSKRLRRDGRLMRGSPDTTLPVRASVWAVSRSLAVTDDITLRFLFLPILRCFSSRGSSLREAIVREILIRKSVVLRLRAAPHSLSQLGTSFISA